MATKEDLRGLASLKIDDNEEHTHRTMLFKKITVDSSIVEGTDVCIIPQSLQKGGPYTFHIITSSEYIDLSSFYLEGTVQILDKRNESKPITDANDV